MRSQAVLKLFAILLLFLYPDLIRAQLWTWMGGGNGTSSVSPVAAVYGTMGVASSSSHPGATTNAAKWQDASGNFWIFGGSGCFSASASNNDLWKYDLSINQWTWMRGSATASTVGAYGTQGVASSTSLPGCRSSCCSWVDGSGNFWIFGGFAMTSSGVGFSNELWKYDLSTNQWTWMGGSTSANQLGAYGSLGVSSSTVFPGARQCQTCWTDASGNLWLFGGQGHASSGSFGYLNDLWRYSISTNQWTWMGGSSVTNQPGAYGTQSVASATTIPGARYGAAIWKDASGVVWLHGGNGYSSNSSAGPGSLGDLWKYNTGNNQWTWIRGSTGLGSTGAYGTMGVGTSTTSPGGRAFAAAWPEINGEFYMFGGSGQNANSGYVHLNDIWKYSPATDVWTWVNGNSQTAQSGVYGTQGLASVNNQAGAKQAMAAFKDASNNLWTFGGSGRVSSRTFVLVNELWKYEICSTPAVPVNTTSAAKQSICSGSTTSLTVLSDAPVTWYNSATAGFSLATGSVIVTPALGAGTFSYFAESKLCNASGSRAMIVATVTPHPTISVTSGSICSGQSYTLASSGAATYTYSGGSQIVSPLSTSVYTISGTSASGCLSNNTATATVSVVSSPTLTLSGSNTLCIGSQVIFTAAGATSYSWSGGVGSATFTDAPATNTMYQVSGENQSGCVSSISIAVSVYPLPVISVSNGTICSGNAYTLNPLGAASYSFSGGSQVVSPSQNSSYTITGESINGCSSSNSVVATVVVNALPGFTLSGSNSVCKGQPVTLLVNGAAVTYTWNNGSNANLVVFSPTINTAYSVSVTGANGCRYSASKFITVDPLPAVMANASSTIVCEGTTLLLSGSGASTYTWSNGVSDNVIFIPLVSTTFSVTGSDANGCENSGSVFVQVAASPTLAISGFSSAICAGDLINLTASGAVSYSWSTGDSTQILQTIPFSDTTFTVEGTHNNKCKSAASILVEVDKCTGLKSVNRSNGFDVFPNPGKDMFFIRQDDGLSQYSFSVYNCLAQLVWEKNNCNNTETFTLENYSVGIYTVIIKTDKNVVFYKLLKN